MISAAGPATNMVLAVFFAVLLATPSPLLRLFGATGFLVNAMLGMFNMIPLPGFDGSKVLAWNKVIYASLLITLVSSFHYIRHAARIIDEPRGSL